MADSTYESAKRCPKCQEPGIDIGSVRGPHGSRMHTIQCRNSRCSWYETNYSVQVNSDGSIPEPTLNRPKTFPALPKRNDEDVERQMQALYQQTQAGGETR